MEKRALLAVALSFIVMMFFWYVLPQKPPPQKPQDRLQESVSQPEVAKPPQGPRTPKTLKKDYEVSKAITSPETLQEQLIYLDSPQLRATFSNLGGALKVVEIKTYHDKQGNNLLISSQENQFFPLTIAQLGEEDLRELPFKILEQTDNSVVFQATTPNGIQVTKSIRLRPAQYLFEMDLEIQNRSKEDVAFEDGYDIAIGAMLPMQNGSHQMGMVGLGIDAIIDNEILRLSQRKVKKDRWEFGNVKWGAVKNQFCAFILKPDQLAVGVGGWQFEHKKDTGLAAVLRMEDFSLIPEESKNYQFLFYSGPKEYDTIKEIGYEFDQVMDFGKILGPFSILILKSLLWIYGWCKNYGVAIIILTVIIKVLTLPLTHKSFKSMKEMQVIQPQLAALREKYKSNPKKLQSEMMAMYKEHRINPLGGCLPLLLQMPILIAFFKTLNNAVELRGAPFMLWIKDLSAPDHLFTLPFSIPFIGNAFNVLPLLMVASFVVQQKMSMAANKGAVITPQQKQQQQMMLVMMPIIFGFLFYNMPSGLVLYFTVSTLLGLAQQYYVLKQPMPGKVKASA